MDGWNDLRLILAVTRAGRLLKAAKTPGIDRSTDFRRMIVLEQAWGLPLCERLPGGIFELAGRKAASTAMLAETEVEPLDRITGGRNSQLSENLRIASSEVFADQLLTNHIAGLREVHPRVMVELMASDRVPSLSAGEADIAFQTAQPRRTASANAHSQPEAFGCAVRWSRFEAVGRPSFRQSDKYVFSKMLDRE